MEARQPGQVGVALTRIVQWFHKQLIRSEIGPINQIKSYLFCHKFSTQYNNEFAVHLAGQTGDNFALMSAHDN